MLVSEASSRFPFLWWLEHPVFSLELGLGIEFALALVDLVLHEIVDPQAHLDVVLEHHDDHAV